MTSPSAQSTISKSHLRAALVGNPNCGKTTLFNGLTGSRQRVGNWPGVTVERKSGFFTQNGKTVEVVDLPGIYSLHQASENAVDERIACEFILTQNVDIVVNILDASNLERHLYLTIQLLEMGLPVVVALNMMDVAESRGITIEVEKLSQQLGCPIIEIKANKGEGIASLKQAISCYQLCEPSQEFKFTYPALLFTAITELSTAITIETKINKTWLATHLLEDDAYAKSLVDANLLKRVEELQTEIQAVAQEDADILLAEARYQFIQKLMTAYVQQATNSKTSWTTRIDNLVLNRILGIPIFLAVMYFLFLFSINIGGAFQDFFDISSETIFVDGLAYLLSQAHSPTWLTALLANGLGKGINTTITFIPVIGAMFLFLALLEDSGYMARAAFVIDRFMRALGLPGKAFVPMIVGFGCNVPAVMAARTLENKRDRILTIMMSPFMSCGARLAIFAVFTTAFFPNGGQNIVFALYLIGIFMAVLTGFILRKTLLRGDASPLVMELPAYHLPHVQTILLQAWHRLKSFVYRAGKLIVPICILIGALNTLNIDGSLNSLDGGTNSILSMIGQWATPIFAPMGLHPSNWPATVGLVTGILAKEVVVGTLNTLYTQMGHFAVVSNADHYSLWAGLYEALKSIPANFAELGNALTNPVLAKAPIDPLEQSVYGLMYREFDGKVGAFAYLLFVLLYFPCISTTAAMLRELHRGWSVFSAIWMTGVAYAVAVIFYQTATIMQHPLSSSIWIISLICLFALTILGIHLFADDTRNKQYKEGKHELA